MKGMAMVVRGADALGTVQYNVTLHDDGRVTGTVVHVVDHVLLHPRAPRVLLTSCLKQGSRPSCIFG